MNYFLVSDDDFINFEILPEGAKAILASLKEKEVDFVAVFEYNTWATLALIDALPILPCALQKLLCGIRRIKVSMVEKSSTITARECHS